MLKNYFQIAWRNVRNHKLLSFITVGGLAVGIATVILIGLYINTELSYDNFHQSGKNIYRVGFNNYQQNTLNAVSPEFTAPFSKDAKDVFPELEDVCRISDQQEGYFNYQLNSFKSSSIVYTDSSFFHFFSFQLVHGNSADVLKEPFAVVLSEELAGKLFGTAEAVGKTISLDGKKNMLVTGVVKNAPTNSTIKFDAVISIATLYHDSTYFMGWNGGWQYQHFVKLSHGASITALKKKFDHFLMEKYSREFGGGNKITTSLQSLEKIHLYYDVSSSNVRTNIFVFGIIALLIVFISCINYININVARAASRVKEVAVRKVLGAGRSQLIKQFIGETFVTTIFSAFIAALLVMASWPFYSSLTSKEISLTANEVFLLVGFIAVLSVIITLIAGSYLSFYLSSLKPANAFKSAIPNSGKHLFGKALIVLQFSITSGLIGAVFVMHLQLGYIKDKPLGYDTKKTVVLPLTGETAQQKVQLLKQQLLAMPGVAYVSAMSEVPYNDVTQNGFLPEGSKQYRTFHQLDADEDFLKTMNVQLLQGNYFSKDRMADGDGYIINKALADQLGWQDPINKTIDRDGLHRIIGVVDNFHFASMHDKIEPLIITNKPWNNLYGLLLVKYSGENPSPLLKQAQALWKQNIRTSPFEYWFLDDAFNRLYQSEIRYQQLFSAFSALSVMLSLSGIFGLILLNIRYKTKEIGIRKVFGADSWSIIQLVAKNFLLLVALSTLVAIPAAWMYSNYWLQQFAYRIAPQWWMFAIACLAAFAFSFVVVVLQAGKASLMNPVKSLRTE